METNNKDRWWGWLITLMLLALIAFAAYCLVTGKTLEGISIVVGVLISKIGTMIDFRYGSSKGSQEKTQMLANEVKPEPGTPEPGKQPIGFTAINDRPDKLQ